MDSYPVPRKQNNQTNKKLHATNSHTEEEVGGSETKQLGARIQSVKLNHEKGTCLKRNMPDNVKGQCSLDELPNLGEIVTAPNTLSLHIKIARKNI